MKASSIFFTLLTTHITLSSCCFISDCPGHGNKRKLYSFRPGISPQVLPESSNVGPIDDRVDVPDKKDLRFLYDMPYRNSKPRAVDDQFLLNVPGKRGQMFTKKGLRFLYDMLYNDNRPRITPRQSKNLNTSWTQGDNKYIRLVKQLAKKFLARIWKIWMIVNSMSRRKRY